jgi:hypothetical protein
MLGDLRAQGGAAPARSAGPSLRAQGVAADGSESKVQVLARSEGQEDRPVQPATDEDVKKLIEALKKSSGGLANELMLAAMRGLWIPEMLLGLQNMTGEVRHGRIGWHLDDAFTALRSGVEDKLPVVVVFCDNANQWCSRLVRDVLTCPAVNRFAGHAVFLWARPALSSNSATLSTALDIDQYPTISVMIPEGDRIRAVESILGFVAARPLATFLESHLGAAGTESEASTIATEQELFDRVVKPDACGDQAPLSP